MRFRTLRLSTRITLIGLLLVVAGAVLWVVSQNRRLQDDYLSERSADIEIALHVEQERLLQSIETLRQDVVFLANTPPVQGIVRAKANNGFDPRDNNPYAIWERRLQEIFSAFLRAHPDYFKARYIGVDDNGRELVRVEYINGHIQVASRAELQSDAEAGYFQAGLGLSSGEIHVTEFDLNRESGKIEVPHRPTLRAVTPVFDARGKMFGMVVLNIDATAVFKSSAAGLQSGVESYITDQDGRYLYHPDAKRAFAFESSDMARITDDFPATKALFESKNQLSFSDVAQESTQDRFVAGRVFYVVGEPARFLTVVYRLPQEVIDAQSAGIRLKDVFDGLLILAAAMVVLLLVLRRSFAPLERIAASARRIAAGDRQIRLSESGGEIGELSDALNSMLDKLVDQEQIENESRFRKELIESLPGVFYMIDINGRFLMWNRNLEEVLQRSGDEIEQDSPLDYFAGGDKERIETAIRKVFEHGDVELEATLIAKDGSKTPYHFTGHRVERDGVPVLIGLGLDISEQRERRRVSEALLRRNQSLMQNSMEGIHVLDIDGNVLEVNNAFCKMLGYTREEALTLNVKDWDDHFSPDELKTRLREFIGKSGIFETVHKRKDGSLLDVEICTSGVEIDGTSYLYAASRDITERKRVEAVLHRNKLVIDTTHDGYWLTDDKGVLLEANQAYANISGYSVAELVGMHISDLEAKEKSIDEVRAHVALIIEQGFDVFETQHRHKDGHVIDIEVSTTFMYDTRQFVVFSRDISERKRAEQEMRIAAAAFETHDAILITDAQANIIRVNRAFTEITGFSAEEVLGKNPRIMSSGKHDREFYVRMWQQLQSFGTWSGEIWDKRKNGEIYPKWMTLTAVRNEQQEIAQYVAIFSDITERKRLEEEMRNLAFYDQLTQLPNRRFFLERLRAALPASARRRDYGALMFLDMDKFKSLNDTLGHEYGDLMLIEVAQRIKACVREMDTVARLGGDEFVILIESISQDEGDASHKVGTVAEKIREKLAQPYQLKEHEHHSSPSIGIAMYRDSEVPVDELLHHADLAMYQAKKGGRNAVCFFDPQMQGNAERRESLENDLRHAAERGELCLYYQVQVDSEQRPVGAEVLLRWNHPQRGLVMPDQFIPVAEESELILDIGRWVLNEACAQLARWRDDESMRQMTLTVNISTRQFARADFVGQVATLIKQYRIEPKRLKLELTEGVVTGDLTGAVEKIKALRDIGVNLAMDDFPTVYSSLHYLKSLSSDQLKIHRDVVQGVTLSESGEAQLVQAIVDLAKSMDMRVFAEGVETEAQFTFLKQHDCKAYQGFLFSKPVPLEELKALMDKQR